MHRNPEFELWRVSRSANFLDRVTVVSIWRLVIFVRAFFTNRDNPDPTYSIGFCISAIEINIAVLCACGPSMKPFANRFAPRLLGSSRRNASAYDGLSGDLGYRTGGTASQNKSLGSRSNAEADERYELGVHHRRADGGDSRRNLTDRDEERIMGTSGIVKTMDVSVKYTGGGSSQRSQNDESVRQPSRTGKSASMDSLV
jgi:hypothetical protein